MILAMILIMEPVGNAPIMRPIKGSSINPTTKEAEMKIHPKKSTFAISLLALLGLMNLVSLVVPFRVQAQPSSPPPAYGVFLQKGEEWIRLQYQSARRVPAGEVGYVIGFMHRTRVFLVGERSKIRLSDRRPAIYFYGANPADFYTLVRLNNKDGLREFHYSMYPKGGSAQVVDEYLVRVNIEQIGKDLYRLTPAQELTPGEYGIVLGDSICPFGIDG
jgi:hypothetical protein